MGIKYDDDEFTYYQKTLELFDGHNNQWKEYRDTWGQTLLHYAARSGCREDFRWKYIWERLLQEYKDPDAVRLGDREGRSALSWAAGTGNYFAIKMLLCPPSTRKNNPQTRNPNITQSSYHKGREIYKNDLDNYGQMPLFHFLLHRSRDRQIYSLLTMKHLIWNFDIWKGKRDSPFSDDREKGSQGSSWQSDYFDKEYLNGKDRDGRSLLSHAVEKKDIYFVRLLLKVKGINVRFADNDGTTPLMHVIQRRDKEMAILLNSYTPQDLPDLPHALIGPRNDSVIDSLKWAFKNKVIDNESGGEAVLQHALNLKHLIAVKTTLKLGVSPRKIFKYRKDWFGLIEDNTTQPDYLIVAETELQNKKEYSLDFPDNDQQTSHHRLLQ